MNSYSVQMDNEWDNDEWGFYIDIEEENKYVSKVIHHEEKSFIIDINYCYDYKENESFDPLQKSIANMLIRVSSTTLATIGLTYLVFSLL